MACRDAGDDESSMSPAERLASCRHTPNSARLRCGPQVQVTSMAAVRRGGFLLPASLGLALVMVLSAVQFSAGSPDSVAEDPAASASGTGRLVLPPYEAADTASGLRRTALPHTEIPKRGRVSVLRYSVQPGDTAWSIAEKFDLAPETILWGNEGLSTEAASLQSGL